MSFDFTVERNSSKWVLGADGYLKEYIADAPAIEFNADGSYKGVLVEPASTNDITYSEDFSTTWTLHDAGDTLTSGQDSPDGGTNAFLFAPDSTNGPHIIRQSYTFTNTTYTISVFLKQAGRRYAHVTYGGATLGFPSYDYRRGVFDLQDGVVYSAPTNGSATIQDIGNGWYRCSVTITVLTGSIASFFDIYHADSTDPTINTVNDGNGTDGIYMWGAQLEESPIATSYIPTTTGAVTRLKDDIYLTSASSLIGQTEGTLFIEVDWQLTAGSFQVLFEVSDGTNANRMAILKRFVTVDEMIFLGRSNTTTVCDITESVTSYTGIQKFAFAYKTDDFKAFKNGSSIGSDTSGSLASLATLTDVNFGQAFGQDNQANMWIRAVALFTTRLSDAEAYSLTGYDTYAQMANALQYTIL